MAWGFRVLYGWLLRVWCVDLVFIFLMHGLSPRLNGGLLQALVCAWTAEVCRLALVNLRGLAVVALFLLPQIAYAQSSKLVQPAPTTNPSAPDYAAEFNRIYSLKGDEVLIHIRPPFSRSRLAFYKRTEPDQAEAIPRGPDSMIVQWQDGEAKIWGMGFGAPESLSHLIQSVMGIFPQETEGEQQLLDQRIPGDFAFKAGAAQDLYLSDMSRILGDEMGSPVNFTFRQVDRKVVVIRGRWKFKAVDDRTGEYVEFYGSKLNADGHADGGGSGDGKKFAGRLGWFVGQQIFLEAEGVPSQITWHYNDAGRANPAGRQQLEDLVLKHIEEQTGLTCTVETRNVRRLFVEQGGL